MKNLSVLEIVDKIKTKQLTCEKLTQYYLNNIIKYKHKNAVLEVFDDALQRAREIDKLVESGVQEGDTVCIYDFEFDFVY